MEMKERIKRKIKCPGKLPSFKVDEMIKGNRVERVCEECGVSEPELVHQTRRLSNWLMLLRSQKEKEESGHLDSST